MSNGLAEICVKWLNFDYCCSEPNEQIVRILVATSYLPPRKETLSFDRAQVLYIDPGDHEISPFVFRTILSIAHNLDYILS